MADLERLKKEIRRRLAPLRPKKVILFGSYAHGTQRSDSDIDLYVVTEDDFIPETFEQKNAIYLKVARAIRDLRKEVAIDLIVHTKKMYEQASQRSFVRDEIARGVELL